MSQAEKRNLAIVVLVGGVLLAGGALLANYSGILRADAQEQAKVSCSSEGKACTESVAATEAAGFPTVHASVDGAPAGGCCPSEKAAGCGEKAASCGEKASGCSDEAGGCTEKAAGCCESKATGCSLEKAAGCCPSEIAASDT